LNEGQPGAAYPSQADTGVVGDAGVPMPQPFDSFYFAFVN
jgi:hypothetical protein